VLVTAAGQGIGRAAALAMAAEGATVWATDLNTALLREIEGTPNIRTAVLDVLDKEAIFAIAESVGPVDALFNCAGYVHAGTIIDASDEDFAFAMSLNVQSHFWMIQALLPAMLAGATDERTASVVMIGSIAGHLVYEGGGSYTSAKHAETALTETLRLELNGQPVRITEIAPGLVRTDEFSLNRFAGDAERANAVYAGVDAPLTAEDIADCVSWVVTRPAHVDIDLMVVKPVAQAAPHKLHRRT